MNKILEKAIEELKKEKPEIQYVLGMLETVVAMQRELIKVPEKMWPESIAEVAKPLIIEDQVSEAEMLDKLAKARLKEVEEMSTVEVVTQK
jgi:hypothetical protein